MIGASSAIARSDSQLIRWGAGLGSRRSGSGLRHTGLVGRIALEFASPRDPLGGAALSPAGIEVMIPAGPREICLLPLVEAGVRRSVTDLVSDVVVVCPTRHDGSWSSLRPFAGRIVPEEGYLPVSIEQAMSKLSGRVHQAFWFRQQAIKLWWVLTSHAPAVLIVDADTVLLQPRRFYDGYRQVLNPVHEFHAPYEEHFRLHFGLGRATAASRAVSFVAHHQIMIPELVREMFSTIAPDPETALLSWFQEGAHGDASTVSEFHTYGRWVMENRSDRAVLARWANAPARRSELLGLTSGIPSTDAIPVLQSRFGNAMSVSAHGYLEGS